MTNKRWLKSQIDAPTDNPHYIHKTSNDGFTNNKAHSYFTDEGLHPGDRTLTNHPRKDESVDLIWLNKNRRYMDEGENLGIHDGQIVSYYQSYPNTPEKSM